MLPRDLGGGQKYWLACRHGGIAVAEKPVADELTQPNTPSLTSQAPLKPCPICGEPRGDESPCPHCGMR
jgi:hypothetical protein